MEQWGTYLRLTESMLALAEQKQWQALDSASTERRALQEAIQSAPSVATEVEPLGQCLEQCIALNQAIAALVDRARAETSASLLRIQLGGQAVAAYRSAKALVPPTNE